MGFHLFTDQQLCHHEVVSTHKDWWFDIAHNVQEVVKYAMSVLGMVLKLLSVITRRKVIASPLRLVGLDGVNRAKDCPTILPSSSTKVIVGQPIRRVGHIFDLFTTISKCAIIATPLLCWR